jgi:hypothetical protein
MKALQKFVGMFGLDFGVAARLDQNFDTLNIAPKPYAVVGTHTLKADDQVLSLQVDATAAAITVYLPVSPTGNRRRTVIKTDASANAVTVNGNGSLINGAATQALAAQYDSITVEPTGTGWLIVAST